MEGETVAAYLREYSELDGLQRAAQVRYALVRRDGALYVEVGGARCALPGLGEAFARRLLCFLYENGVAPAQLGGVLRDLCGLCAAG